MSVPNIEYWNNIFPPLEPFYTAQTDDYTPLPRDAASQAAMNGQNWHLNMLKLVGSWVAKGNTDGEIRILAENHTLPGYTVEQTWLDVQPMIAGARRKNFAPANSNEAHDGPVPRKILTLISDVELKDPEYLIDDVIEEKSLIGSNWPVWFRQNLCGLGYCTELGDWERLSRLWCIERSGHHVGWRGASRHPTSGRGLVQTQWQQSSCGIFCDHGSGSGSL